MSISFYTHKKKIQMVDFNDVDKIVRLDFFSNFTFIFLKILHISFRITKCQILRKIKPWKSFSLSVFTTLESIFWPNEKREFSIHQTWSFHIT